MVMAPFPMLQDATTGLSMGAPFSSFCNTHPLLPYVCKVGIFFGVGARPGKADSTSRLSTPNNFWGRYPTQIYPPCAHVWLLLLRRWLAFDEMRETLPNSLAISFGTLCKCFWATSETILNFLQRVRNDISKRDPFSNYFFKKKK